MAIDQSALLELIEMMRSADEGELMRRLLATMVQALVDAEATEFIGAEPHERSEARTTQRNGTRDKLVTTTAGDLQVKIPKVRTGSFFPALLSPRRRIDVALHAVVMQAYVEGVSTRRVDDLVVALGRTGISKSEVSRICVQLDTEVAAWRDRTLGEQAFPYVFLDATYCKVRINARVVSQAVVIATGVSADGRREVLGCAVGDGETETFWTEFLRDLRDRGLGGVQLVVSPTPTGGLTNAVAAVLQGAPWQRCRVHFMRNALAKVTKGHAEMVAATIRTIFAQPTGDLVREQVDTVAGILEAERLEAAAALPTALVEYRHAQIARRVDQLRTGNRSEPLSNEVRAARAEAWSALYRLELLVDDRPVRDAAYQLMGRIKELKTIDDPARLDVAGTEVHWGIQNFIELARTRLAFA